MNALRDERLTDERLAELERLLRTDKVEGWTSDGASLWLAVNELLKRRKAEVPSWVVSFFNPDSLWGAVEDTRTGRSMRFHSTSYQGRTWPYAGARVDVVFNHAGALLAVHEVA